MKPEAPHQTPTTAPGLSLCFNLSQRQLSSFNIIISKSCTERARAHRLSTAKMSQPASFSTPSLPPSAIAAATKTHTQHRFQISTCKLPISKAEEIDAMTDRIGIPMPEMIFGANVVSLKHKPTNWTFTFNTYDALDGVDKTDKHMLKVAYARDWESTREGTTQKIKEVVKPYDWSYSTFYSGSLENASTPAKEFKPSEKLIPIELLKRRDPILFFDEVMLYESELDDNGISMFSVKVRVHDKRMLLLCRLFMRLDNVVVRVRDTRVYVDFETDEVIREYSVLEETFENVKRKLFMSGRLPDDITIALRDPNIIAPLLKVLESRTEAVDLKD